MTKLKSQLCEILEKTTLTLFEGPKIPSDFPTNLIYYPKLFFRLNSFFLEFIVSFNVSML